MTPVFFAIATFVSTLAGGLFGIKNRAKLHLIISFTAGVLIAVAFFDVLPEVITLAQDISFPITNVMIALVVGFLAIHTMEKLAAIHGGHEHEHEHAEHKHPWVGYVSASGLAIHSFMDGIGIGLGFHAGPHIGFLIAFAVIAHDFSDGLNTVSFMLLSKHTIKKSIIFLLIDAITPILGVATTYLFTISQNWLVIYLGFFAGFLIYLGASDLLPEAHSKESSLKIIGLTFLGIIFIFVVTRFV